MVGSAVLRNLFLRNLKSFSGRDRGAKRGSHPLRRWIPMVELLEDRWVPTILTSTSLSDSALGSSIYGQNVVFTAAVTDSQGTPVSQGAVDFSQSGTSLAAAVPVDSSGHATYHSSQFSAGSHTFTA